MKAIYESISVKKQQLNCINELTLQLPIDEKYYIKNNGFNLQVLNDKAMQQELELSKKMRLLFQL